MGFICGIIFHFINWNIESILDWKFNDIVSFSIISVSIEDKFTIVRGCFSFPFCNKFFFKCNLNVLSRAFKKSFYYFFLQNRGEKFHIFLSLVEKKVTSFLSWKEIVGNARPLRLNIEFLIVFILVLFSANFNIHCKIYFTIKLCILIRRK